MTGIWVLLLVRSQFSAYSENLATASQTAYASARPRSLMAQG